MGGRGSGRPRTRETVKKKGCLDVRKLHKEYAIHYIPGSVTLLRAHGVTIKVVYTPCHFGGFRPWLQCPGCEKRKGSLYPAGDSYRCRECLHLIYPVQRFGDFDRAKTRAFRYRRQLGGKASSTLDLFTPVYEKPKGMHWKRFRILQEKDEQAGLFLQMEIARLLTGQVVKLEGLPTLPPMPPLLHNTLSCGFRRYSTDEKGKN